MYKYALTIASFLLLLLSQSVFAQLSNEVSPKDNFCGEKSAKILILGTYHMDNPGQDAYNLQADDVLSPKRQREIAEVIEKLSRFKPTKIAIESPYRNTRWTELYKQYLAGKYQLGRNEVEQVGFQLAKRMNLPTLHPVDFPMWMNGWMPSEIESPKPKSEATPKPAESKQPQPKPALPAYVAKADEILRTGSVLDEYRYLNSEEYIQASHTGYMGHMLPPTESVYMYQGADLLTNWYKRNIRIFTNVNRITEFPNDRVLLIIGSGHLKILRDFSIDSQQFCFIDTDVYLR